jgi:hypothetical protein
LYAGSRSEVVTSGNKTETSRPVRTASLSSRGLRFSLRTLLVLLTVAGIWIAILANRARQQRAAVVRIEELGGGVNYDWEFDDEGRPLRDSTPPGWPWLRRLIGPEYFQEVVTVNLTGTSATDADMGLIGKLRHVGTLSLHGTEVSDAGLRELRYIAELRYFGLAATKVTDDGLQCLARCKRLQDLNLEKTPVGDEGMDHIAGLDDLSYLSLARTKVTSRGLLRIAGLPKLQQLCIDDTAVDDGAVEALITFLSTGEFKVIRFDGTQISGRGQQALCEALPKDSDIMGSDVAEFEDWDFTASAHWKEIADRLHALDGERRVKVVDLSGSTLSDEQLAMLHSLKHVELIDLRGARVSDAAARTLQVALPDCEIDR